MCPGDQYANARSGPSRCQYRLQGRGYCADPVQQNSLGPTAMRPPASSRGLGRSSCRTGNAAFGPPCTPGAILDIPARVSCSGWRPSMPARSRSRRLAVLWAPAGICDAERGCTSRWACVRPTPTPRRGPAPRRSRRRAWLDFRRAELSGRAAGHEGGLRVPTELLGEARRATSRR